MQSTFWWVWLLMASCAWILQRLISERSDKTVPERELTLFWGAVRILLFTVMILCFALGVILFVEWAGSDSHRLA
jgi:Na+/proline symporter